MPTLARAAGVLGVLLSVAGHAAELDYSYLEGGFVNLDYERGGDDSGLRIAGSLDIGSPVVVIGEYADTGDIAHLAAGLLLYVPRNRRLDLTAGLTVEHVDVDVDDDLGIGLRGGLRWLALTAAQNPGRLEVGAELRHVFIFSDSLTSLRGSAAFRIADGLDLAGALQFGDDDRMELGLRYALATAYPRRAN